VVGDHFWAARQGLTALNPRWRDGANAARSSKEIMAELKAIAAGKAPWPSAKAIPTRALAKDTRVDAIYQVPFLAMRPWSR